MSKMAPSRSTLHVDHGYSYSNPLELLEACSGGHRTSYEHISIKQLLYAVRVVHQQRIPPRFSVLAVPEQRCGGSIERTW